MIENPIVVFEIEPESEARDVRTLYLGDDWDGRPLEVMAVAHPRGGLLVVHAMDLRDKYREAYELAKKLQSDVEEGWE